MSPAAKRAHRGNTFQMPSNFLKPVRSFHSSGATYCRHVLHSGCDAPRDKTGETI